MPNFKLFDIASHAMSAQTVRLNTIASNMANVESVSNSKETAYKSIHPVFQTHNLGSDDFEMDHTKSVKVNGITKNDRPNDVRYDPTHPHADKDGYVYLSNVNIVEEMADMIAASRAYQASAQIMSTTKDMMQSTINLAR